MRIALFILVLMFLHQYSFTQRSAKWLVGHGSIIDFTVSPTITYLECDTFKNSWFSNGYSMICDKKGDVLFEATPYVVIKNTCESYNAMENGDYNPSMRWEKEEWGQGYYPQLGIILPKKGDQYYSFYKTMSNAALDSLDANLSDFHYDLFRYHIIDMKENNGNGKVILKEQNILEGARLSPNALSAVQHANGRDWWLVMPHREKDWLYTFLVTPDAIIPYPVQDMGGPDFHASNWGQSNFSPDGSLYAVTQYGSPFTQVNSFDRCTGKMTRIKSIPPLLDTIPYYDVILQKDTFWVSKAQSGVCFSSDNKYLYMVGPYDIFQYDLSNDNYSKLRNDGLWNNAYYVQAYNAPDGRIYMGNDQGTERSLSYIEFPLKKGLDAHLCQFCLPTIFTTQSPPNMPNYELGALAGSACDTLRFAPIVAETPIVVPNAFSPNGDGLNDTWHILNVAALQYKGYFVESVGVYNRWGNEVFKSSDINFSWDAKGWASDSYYYYIRFKTKDGVSKVQKGSVSVVR